MSMPQDPHEGMLIPFLVIMKVMSRNEDGTIDVRLIPDDVPVPLNEFDEFFTAAFNVDPFRTDPFNKGIESDQ